MNKTTDTKEARKTAAGGARGRSRYVRTPFGRRLKSNWCGWMKVDAWRLVGLPLAYIWDHMRRGVSKFAEH